jgi:APA family basic amino acid/polyamine antiporter
VSAASESRDRSGLIRGLGPIATTALVAGNMIGSGVYVTPGALAEVAGPASLLAWGLVAVCYFSLTAVYADLAVAFPITGGLQVFAQRAFGDLAGFLTAFLYWISGVIGNAAFVTAFVAYFQVFVPWFAPPVHAFFLGQVFLWSLTIVNIIGVRTTGAVQVFTTIVKVLPLFVLSIAFFSAGSSANLTPFAPHGYWALFPAISLVAWLFLGAESATVPAEEVKGAGPTIKRAAYVGYGFVAIVYLVLAFSINYGLPASAIAGKASPLADAAGLLLGPLGTWLVTLGALISITGILNGWLLVVGRLPLAAARQGIGPALFGRIHPRTGTPIAALVLNSAITAALASLYFFGTLLDAYNFIALAATATALVAIAIACLAEVVLVRREPERFTPAQRVRGPVTAILGFVAVLVMIVGTGLYPPAQHWYQNVWFLTFCAAVVPIPFFYLFRAARPSRDAA